MRSKACKAIASAFYESRNGQRVELLNTEQDGASEAPARRHRSPILGQLASNLSHIPADQHQAIIQAAMAKFNADRVHSEVEDDDQEEPQEEQQPKPTKRGGGKGKKNKN